MQAQARTAQSNDHAHGELNSRNGRWRARTCWIGHVVALLACTLHGVMITSRRSASEAESGAQPREFDERENGDGWYRLSTSASRHPSVTAAGESRSSRRCSPVPLNPTLRRTPSPAGCPSFAAECFAPHQGYGTLILAGNETGPSGANPMLSSNVFRTRTLTPAVLLPFLPTHDLPHIRLTRRTGPETSSGTPRTAVLSGSRWARASTRTRESPGPWLECAQARAGVRPRNRLTAGMRTKTARSSASTSNSVTPIIGKTSASMTTTAKTAAGTGTRDAVT